MIYVFLLYQLETHQIMISFEEHKLTTHNTVKTESTKLLSIFIFLLLPWRMLNSNQVRSASAYNRSQLPGLNM
jgi:hypothetical protein